MDRIKAVIFDLFGTLVDPFGASTGQMQAEFSTALAMPHERFLRIWNQTLERRITGAFESVEAAIEHVCAVIGVEVSAQQITEAVEIRLRYTRHALSPRPDAVATLGHLKSHGLKIGLITNASIEIPTVWPETAFVDLIDEAIFSSRARLKKPDPRIYILACRRLSVAPESCLYIGDGEDHELSGAARVGLHPVLIRTSSEETMSGIHREAEEWQGAAITRLREVLQLVVRGS